MWWYVGFSDRVRVGGTPGIVQFREIFRAVHFKSYVINRRFRVSDPFDRLIRLSHVNTNTHSSVFFWHGDNRRYPGGWFIFRYSFDYVLFFKGYDCIFNSFSAGPYKRRTCTVYGTVYDFADSYLRFGACYVDENITIRFSETISPNSYR
jgi:hypothetical protein